MEYLPASEMDPSLDLPKGKKWRVELEFVWEADEKFAPNDLKLGIIDNYVRVVGPDDWHALHGFIFRVKDPDTGVTLYEIDLSANNAWAPYP